MGCIGSFPDALTPPNCLHLDCNGRTLEAITPAPMPFGSHIIDVAEADAPELGTAVTLTFALQA